MKYDREPKHKTSAAFQWNAILMLFLNIFKHFFIIYACRLSGGGQSMYKDAFYQVKIIFFRLVDKMIAKMKWAILSYAFYNCIWRHTMLVNRLQVLTTDTLMKWNIEIFISVYHLTTHSWLNDFQYQRAIAALWSVPPLYIY